MKYSRQEKMIIAGAVATSIILGVVVYMAIRKKKKSMTIQGSKLKSIADEDKTKWNGKKETDPTMSDTLLGYWKTVGKYFTPSQMQSSSFQQSNPWSSAYVSHLVTSAGFKNFVPRSFHSTYVVDAKENRIQGKKEAYWAFNPSENKKVEIGDILVKNRGGNSYTYDTIKRGVPTHGDIVVDLIKKDGVPTALIQGGNVSNTVTRSEVKLKPDGTTPTNFIAHLKYQK